MSEEKKSSKKKVSPQVWKSYQMQGSGITRLKRECPRCGKGVSLGEHSDRFTCGKCGYTLFKKKE